jgi:hypothetical protein
MMSVMMANIEEWEAKEKRGKKKERIYQIQ